MTTIPFDHACSILDAADHIQVSEDAFAGITWKEAVVEDGHLTGYAMSWGEGGGTVTFHVGDNPTCEVVSHHGGHGIVLLRGGKAWTMLPMAHQSIATAPTANLDAYVYQDDSDNDPTFFPASAAKVALREPSPDDENPVAGIPGFDIPITDLVAMWTTLSEMDPSNCDTVTARSTLLRLATQAKSMCRAAA